MPRRGRSSGSSGFRPRSTSPPPRQAPTATRPLPTHTPIQPQTQQRGGLMSGIGSTIAQGMAFGAGSEVAHQTVRSFMGGPSHGQQVEQ